MSVTTTITLHGNLTAEPELRFTAGGTPVTEAVVLVNRRVRDEAGEWTDAEPTRHRIKAFHRLAENLATLPKGATVLATGRVETQAWTDKDTDQRRTSDIVLVDAIGASLAWATVTITKNQPGNTNAD